MQGKDNMQDVVDQTKEDAKWPTTSSAFSDMSRPLSHSGVAMSMLIRYGDPVVGMLVYASGEPQRIGIVRDFKKDPQGFWNSKVLVEWTTGKKVWRHAGSIASIDSKINEEERVLDTLKNARFAAERHFHA